MGNRDSNKIVVGSLRYKSAPDINMYFNIPFNQTFKENVEYDRSSVVELAEVYDNERQTSTIIRPTYKVNLLFKNLYVGVTKYPPFSSSLYYENISKLTDLICGNQLSNNLSYTGYPQYNEFNFIRTDYDISGYTINDVNGNKHIPYIPKSSTTYNWLCYLSYPYGNEYSRQLQALDKRSGVILTWTASDGIPFVIGEGGNSSNEISFRCPIKHGVSVGEFIKLNFNYNGTDIFQVTSLGDGYFNSEDYVINISNIGYTGVTFDVNVKGTLKRMIINGNNETLSKYYVKTQKMLTDDVDSVITKIGFEQNVYNKKRKLESNRYTSNKQNRISFKEGNDVYNVTFKKDIDISSYRDNHNRPITELFTTIIWKGYFGWTFGTPKISGQSGYYNMKQGYDFNIHPSVNSVNTIPDGWWDNRNINSDSQIQLETYTTPLSTPNKPFTYNKPLKVDDIIDGDLCEWNEYELNERVISDLYHKIKFNPNYFKLPLVTGVPPQDSFHNPMGYYYKPHHPMTIRVYSNYVEEGDKSNVVGIPDYAIYSSTNGVYRWRDIYTYGYFDEKNRGVDYPFFNGVHYPYSDIIFRLIPEGSNYKDNTAVAVPKIDNCE
jgi:hypothetical protein